jgi:hypothetical protein
VRGPKNTHERVEVREIENGFVARHSKSSPTGYDEREVYHPKMPEGVAKAFNMKDVRKAEGRKVKDT